VKARLGLLALVTLVHLGLLWVYWHPQPKALLGDEARYRASAGEILAGHEPEPDLLWPPLYPRFLALALHHPGTSLRRVQLAQTLLLVLIAGLLWDVTRRLTGLARAAEAAAWLVLLYPPLVAFAHYLWPEILHLALFLAVLWIVVARRESLAWMPVAGLLLGLALLTKSLLGPFLPMLLWPVVASGPWARRIARLALVVAALAATVIPTMIANRPVAGGYVIADSSIFNVWVGLHDRSRKSLVDEVVADEYAAYSTSAATFAERNLILSTRIVALLRERGVLTTLRAQLGRQYFRLFDKDSYLTDQLPDGPMGRVGMGYHGTPPAVMLLVRGASYALYALVLVGAALGLVLCPPRGRAGLWIVLAFLAYNLGIFLVLHVKSRYEIQFLPFLFLYAGCAWEWLLDSSERAPQSLSPLGRLLALPLAALLLFLAFGADWL
jgi:4-amino-4-deoxy-L-arabinose transferase-like glycosyltransferase